MTDAQIISLIKEIQSDLISIKKEIELHSQIKEDFIKLRREFEALKEEKSIVKIQLPAKAPALPKPKSTLPVIVEELEEYSEQEKPKRILSQEHKEKMKKGREEARALKLQGVTAKVNL
jgi:hypothetical protein